MKIRAALRVVLATSVPAVAVALGSVATAADLSDTGERAFADIAACVATADHLLTAIVVDQSGSLAETDPGNQRVPAIVTALDALEQLRTSSQGRLDVQSNLAVFGTAYTTLVGWGPLDTIHADLLRSVATSELPGRHHDNLTDYREALNGARQSLNDQARAVGGTSCKVILWFTDGQLDAGPATDMARDDLCQPQGLVDAVRGDQISIVALALFTDAGRGSVAKEDRDLLRAAAEGRAGSSTCGTVPIPESSTAGAYLRADDAGALRRLFAQAAALIEGGTPGDAIACPSDACIAGELEIPLDPTIERFRLVIEAPVGSAAPQLRTPDSNVVALDQPSVQVGDASVSMSVRDGLRVVDVTDPHGSGGTWSLLTDPSVTIAVDVYYFWGVNLAVDAPEGIVLGESNEVQITLRHSDGSAVALDKLASAQVDVEVDGKTESVARAGDGWSFDYTTAEDSTSSAISIAAVVHAASDPHGVQLGPVTASATFDTKLPPSFPAVAPSRLGLSDLVGSGTGTGDLTLSGSDRGNTDVCVGAASTSGPVAAGSLTVTSDRPCVQIPANGSATLTITIAAESPADGRIDGVLPLELTGVDGDKRSLQIPFSASMVRPVDEGKRWELVGAFVLLAVALAWATAEVSRRLADRFVLGPDTKSAAVDVVVSEAGPVRAGDSSKPLYDAAHDFEHQGILTRQRLAGFAAQGLHFTRRFPINPFQAGQPWVSAADGGVVITGNLGHAPRDLSRAPYDFPGTGGFVLVADHMDDDNTVQGRLLIIVDAPEGVAEVLPDRLDRIVHGTSWDLILKRVSEAFASRHEAAVRSARRIEPAPGSQLGGNDVGELAAAGSSSGAEADGPPRVPNFFDDAEPGRSFVEPPPSSASHDVGPFLASGEPGRGRRKGPGRDRGDRAAPGMSAGASDDSPPSSDFWE